MHVLLNALYPPAKHGWGCYLALQEFQKRKGSCKVSAELPASRNAKVKKKKNKSKKSVNHKVVGMLKVEKPLQLLRSSRLKAWPAGLTSAFKRFPSITTCPKSATKEVLAHRNLHNKLLMAS